MNVGSGVNMQKIRIITDNHVQYLQDKVNRALSDGYEIVGAVQAFVTASGSREYMATVVKRG